jgi:hypothetical protein
MAAHQIDIDNSNPGSAMIKIFWAWLLVGINQMSPLQAVQFAAGILAIIYTAAQLVVLLRDKFVRDKAGKECK